MTKPETAASGGFDAAIWACAALLVSCILPNPAGWGAVVTMKSGMQFEGRVAKIAAINDNPLNPAGSSGEVDVQPIVIIDDDLRRIFVGSQQVTAYAENPPLGHERIRIDQRVAASGRGIGSIGTILRVTPFDEYGRRIFSMQGPQGKLDVIQGITEVTPSYTKVQGLLVDNPFVWDMRLATSSIPRTILSKILRRQVGEENPDGRLQIVRLYIQARRYQDALLELNDVIKKFPDLSHLQEQASRLKQLLAQELLDEIALRQAAGQHQRVNLLLQYFPDKGVAGETLLQVRDRLAEYEVRKMQYDRVLSLLEKQIPEIKDEGLTESLRAIHEEIRTDLSVHTLSRMADYLRLADDETLTVNQQVGLAISGWLLGSGAGMDNLAVALSLVKSRDLAAQYLRSKLPHERTDLLEQLKAEEGGAPRYLAPLLAHMKPPFEVPEQVSSIPGLYEITIPGIEEQPEFQYTIQLPPEYHPLRRYPCVVTLHGAGTTAERQIEWWAGDYDEKTQVRRGQASRHGYIVLAPHWTKPYQQEYEFSPREHAAVLFSLRDALRRFSIDTDRIFLSGHSLGGNAAWDLGVAHPDLWAGVIPIVAKGEKYIHRYTENAKGLPFYFVGGEKDGGWLSENALELERYLKKPGYDVTIVQYQGRGHEHFQDEIQHLFTWMSLDAHRRNFFPREVEVVSMRPWDNYFWWLELEDFPAETMVVPAQWPPSRGIRPVPTRARVQENNHVVVRTGAQLTTVWLSPELVSFERRIEVSINGRDVKQEIQPNAEVILEDVRTRGDRQHPFWAKVDSRRKR